MRKAKIRILVLPMLILSLFILLQFAAADAAYALEREILHMSNRQKQLQEIVALIQDPAKKDACASMAQQRSYFVRIAPTKHILAEDRSIRENAILGTKPYVFMTTPEEICGKSLLEIYLNIGYEAEDIIRWQKGTDMVAVVFRYPENITYSDITNGALPEKWNRHIYAPTWDNIFSIFEKLASDAKIDPDKKGEFSPGKTFFRNAEDKDFVLNFPAKQDIRETAYAALKVRGGENWRYRLLLEKKLSIFEHFRGNGRTINETLDPDGTDKTSGIFEFVGPNRKIRDLPEVAVIHLGALLIYDKYSKTAE